MRKTPATPFLKTMSKTQVKLSLKSQESFHNSYAVDEVEDEEKGYSNNNRSIIDQVPKTLVQTQEKGRSERSKNIIEQKLKDTRQDEDSFFTTDDAHEPAGLDLVFSNSPQSTTPTTISSNDLHTIPENYARSFSFSDRESSSFDSEDDHLQALLGQDKPSMMKIISAIVERLKTVEQRALKAANNASRTGGALQNLQHQISTRSSTSSFVLTSTGLGSSFEDKERETRLSSDTFTLMMIKIPFSSTWNFSLVTFSIQVTLLALIFKDQLASSSNSTPLNVPFTVSGTTRIAQLLALMITVGRSDDVIISIKEVTTLWHKDTWHKVVDKEIRENEKDDSDRKIWFIQIFFPNLLKFVEGILVMIVTFVLIIQSSDIIDLFKDFAAMYLIAELDNVAFSLANHGYFGSDLQIDADRAKRITVVDRVPRICCEYPLRPVILVSLLISMFSAFSFFAFGQDSGMYFYMKYPNCGISAELIPKVGDGRCDGKVFNTYQCGFDAGDCTDFNMAYPNCKINRPFDIGDGQCQAEYDHADCGYDGGDCCGVDKLDPFLGDGKFCHAGHYNTRACGNDNGDCNDFLERFPFCPEFRGNSKNKDGNPAVIGDGICDFISPAYMSEKCGFEDGDCASCVVEDPFRLGNGICDGGAYNTEACGYDFGDCDKCNKLLTKGDIALVGDGICNGGFYMSEECGNDGGDCTGCNVDDPLKVGDGRCDYNSMYNTNGCSWDGGDCTQRNADIKSKYPNCMLSSGLGGMLGDQKCDSIFNNTECGLDDGDCACSDDFFDINGDGRC